jgi:hypothetical protein
MIGPKFSFCDDLGAPELCVIIDMDWWLKNKSNIVDWLREQGHQMQSGLGMDLGMMLVVPDEVRPLFILKFQGFTG